MTTNSDRFVAVFRREVRTLVRSRELLALSLGFAVAVFAIGLSSEASGFVPLALTLLTPLELLVPVFVAGFAYRSILEDRRRGELAILGTYPVTGFAYIGGVYAGQLAALLVSVVVPLISVALVIPLSEPETFLATYSGLDSPVLYLRFVVLTALYVGVVLSVMIAVSAVTASAKRAFAVALTLALLLAVGLDLLALVGIGAGLSIQESLLWVLSFSPNSAYRGLVMALVTNPVLESTTRAPPVVASLFGFCLWFGGAFGAALYSVLR